MINSCQKVTTWTSSGSCEVTRLRVTQAYTHLCAPEYCKGTWLTCWTWRITMLLSASMTPTLNSTVFEAFPGMKANDLTAAVKRWTRRSAHSSAGWSATSPSDAPELFASARFLLRFSFFWASFSDLLCQICSLFPAASPDKYLPRPCEISGHKAWHSLCTNTGVRLSMDRSQTSRTSCQEHAIAREGNT